MGARILKTDRSSAGPKWVHILTRAALLSVIFASSAPARAQGATGSSAMDDEARRLYDEARKAKDKGDFATCSAKTRAAWALKKHRQVAGLLGECELKTGAHREAAEHLGYFLDHAEDAAPDLVSAVRALYDQACAEIAVVTVKTSLVGADRKVDGRPLAADEARVFLTPGEHTFSATKADGGSAEKRLFVAAGQVRDVLLELEAPKDAAVAPPATPTTTPPETPSDDGPSILPGLVLGGVGLVAVGVGIGLIAAGGSAGSDADAVAIEVNADSGRCDPDTIGFEARCDEFRSAAGDEATLTTASAISLVGGGALLIGGVVWTIVAATSDSGGASATSTPLSPRLTVVPTFSPSGGGLHAAGTF